MPDTLSEEKMIPVVRARVARLLADDGIRSKDIALALNVTQAAVAQYLKKKRGIAPHVMIDVDLLAQPLAEKVAGRIRAGGGELPTVELLEAAHQILILNRGRDVAAKAPTSARHRKDIELLRERLKLELGAAERYMELASKADDQTKLLLRMIASDSVRHGDVVAQMITWLESDGEASFEAPPKSLLQTLLDLEDSANEANLRESIAIEHPVGKLLLEWIDTDEAKHGKIISKMLQLSKPGRATRKD